jgi:hypothetical protein
VKLEQVIVQVRMSVAENVCDIDGIDARRSFCVAVCHSHRSSWRRRFGA